MPSPGWWRSGWSGGSLVAAMRAPLSSSRVSRNTRHLGDASRGRERRYLGHNPAGAAMIVALLVTLSGTAFTGWLMAEPDRVAMLPAMPAIVTPALADDEGEASEYGERSEAGGPLKEVHETLATLMLLLAALHMGGVVLASFRHHENLARAMVTGDKRAPGPGDIA